MFSFQAASAPTCGSYVENTNSNSYGSASVSAEIKMGEAHGKSCTDYPSVNFARSTISCSGTGDTTKLYLKKEPQDTDWDEVDFNCGRGGCNSYDQSWGEGERDITVRTSSGPVKDLFWICYDYEDNGDWAWTWTGYHDYNSQDVDQQANDPSSPSPSNGETDVSKNPTLQVDVSDPDGDDIDVTFRDGDGN